jgi:tripartite-type tricarboxylate transporter receptor subunit TctC
MTLQQGQSLQLAAGVIVLGILLVGGTDQGARSQSTRPIRVVSPTAPGGANDVAARLLVEQIGRAEGLTMVVENRPGAGSVIGTEAVSHAAADGNTVLINASPAFVIDPHLRKLGYDPFGSFEPLCSLASFPTVIAVNSKSPYRTLADLTNAARAMPGQLTLAGLGPGTLTQIGFEVIKRTANVKMTFVPYAGTAPAVDALLGEHVTSYFGNYTNVAEHVKTGRLRMLATATRTRIDAMPDVPTVAESGYNGYEIDAWLGLFAPAKTPREVLSRLVGWFTTALRVQDVKAKLIAQGVYPDGTCGADFAALLRREYEKYGRIIRETGIKME